MPPETEIIAFPSVRSVRQGRSTAQHAHNNVSTYLTTSKPTKAVSDRHIPFPPPPPPLWDERERKRDKRGPKIAMSAPGSFSHEDNIGGRPRGRNVF